MLVMDIQHLRVAGGLGAEALVSPARDQPPALTYRGAAAPCYGLATTPMLAIVSPLVIEGTPRT